MIEIVLDIGIKYTVNDVVFNSLMITLDTKVEIWVLFSANTHRNTSIKTNSPIQIIIYLLVTA